MPLPALGLGALLPSLGAGAAAIKKAALGAGAGAGMAGLTGLATRVSPEALQRALRMVKPAAASIVGALGARPGGTEARAPQITGVAAGFTPVSPRTVPHDFIGPLRPGDTRLPSPPSQPATPMAAIERAAAQPGEFAARPPAPAVREAVRDPVVPTPAPTPASLPPAPALAGARPIAERVAPTPAPLPPPPALAGGVPAIDRAIPTPAALPPSPALAGGIFQPEGGVVGQPVGQFEAMIRALQAQQADPARFVQMPLMGEAPFGPATAQERALRRLREQALERVLGGAAV